MSRNLPDYNLDPPDDVDSENPAVLEMCRVAHDEYYSNDGGDIPELEMRVATCEQPDDAVIQMLVASLRGEYQKSLEKFTDKNYWKFYEKWLDREMSV